MSTSKDSSLSLEGPLSVRRLLAALDAAKVGGAKQRQVAFSARALERHGCWLAVQSSRCAVASVRVALVWSSLLASVATARLLAASGYVALGGSLLSRCTHAPTGCRATVQRISSLDACNCSVDVL